jgi:hypothetical protein
MGKFVLSVINKAKAAKSALKLKTAMKGQQGLYTFFSIWFYVIDQYVSKKPSSLAKTAMSVYLIPFTPSSWVCDDKGFEGMSARRRLKIIKSNFSKEGIVKDNDVLWLKNDLRKGFELDLKQKGLDINSILLELPEDKIEAKVNTLKQEKKYKELIR